MPTLEYFKKMKPGIECFNRQEYWECHEELEHVWLEDRNDPVRNIYWAIIQVAAALIHYRQNNIIGAQGMIIKAKEKFKRCHEFKILNADVEAQLDWSLFERLSLSIPSESAVLNDFKELFDFRFKNFKG